MSREVPSGWNSVELNELTLTPDGLQTGPFGSQLKASEYTESGIPVVMPSDIVNGKIDVRNIARVPEATANRLETHKLVGGDIVFARRGDIGRCSIVQLDQTGYLCGTGCLRARLNPKLITAAFADHLFKSAPVVEWLKEHAVGQTMLNLNTAIISKIPLLLPPPHEQRRIAEILSSVDEAIAATRAVIEQTRKVKQGVLERLLTKGIGHTRFKHTEIGEIPEGWSLCSLAEIAKIKHGYAFSGEFFSREEGSHILLTPGNFSKEKTLYFGPNTKFYQGPIPSDFILKNGDLLVVMTDLTPSMEILGNAVILSSDKTVLHNQRIGKVEVDGSILSAAFVKHVLNSERVQRQIKKSASGTTVRHTSPSRILENIAVLPPMAEQLLIVKALRNIDDGLELQIQNLERASSFKSALMSDLLTGRKRVTDALPMAAE